MKAGFSTLSALVARPQQSLDSLLIPESAVCTPNGTTFVEFLKGFEKMFSKGGLRRKDDNHSHKSVPYVLYLHTEQAKVEHIFCTSTRR